MLRCLFSDWAVWSKAPLDMSAEIHNFRKIEYKGTESDWIDKTGFTEGNAPREPPTFESDVGDLLTDIDRQMYTIGRQGILLVVAVATYGGILVAVLSVLVGLMSAVMSVLDGFAEATTPHLEAAYTGGKAAFGLLLMLCVLVCFCKAAECE